MLTDEQFAAEVDRRNKIRDLMCKLKVARENLAFANKHGVGKTWTAHLSFKKSEWGTEQTSLVCTIPFGVIQQQMVNDVAKLEREIRLLGGDPQ